MTTAKYSKTTHNGRDVRVIEADSEAISVVKIDNTVTASGNYGVNGTFFSSSNDFLGIAVNNDTAIGGNARFNAYGNKQRGTFYCYRDLRSGNRVHDVANVRKVEDFPLSPNMKLYAIGGLNLYVNENIIEQEFYRRLDVNEEASGINNVIKKSGSTYSSPGLRARTAIGYSYTTGKVVLVVFQSETPWGMRQFMKDKGCAMAVYLDGGGSSQMRYKSGQTTGTFVPESASGIREVFSMVKVNPTAWQ
ncbi:phosphodiester glycosidase family protein [Paenibacillus agilis]|uniref:Phosphodiester glycosidase family protein n=1 Tax=Paenibacillus agilis TaxID=3020863 RepID=A0A559IXJ7_9BACL|nr:phosphodiester glycosidase family protein [Paenibacillus agilis]TVX92359.1 phosphodiester glycosidase family protein [Paenibacillus agilis]